MRGEADYQLPDLDEGPDVLKARVGMNQTRERRCEVEAAKVEHLGELVSREGKLAVRKEEPSGDGGERCSRLVLRGVAVAGGCDSLREREQLLGPMLGDGRLSASEISPSSVPTACCCVKSRRIST
jgi:hypothetical protein